ncbi:hypothetical protein HNQ50_000656 [Silvimonas terrae]|uniref:Flagellar protein FliT n=1 Tax=Silvimonas terrae TaxID=300266 RepID=A0A840RBZ1_9NEIS|nr:flagellar protein FliT [Silvimonas terrae]MBB5189946.1 hypothetical protein [Silvimonas terrae]
MLLSAQSADWEDFLQVADRFNQISSTLGDVDWQGMQQDQRELLAMLMRTAQAQIDAIVPLATARRQELMGSIRSLKNGDKMRRMYGS